MPTLPIDFLMPEIIEAAQRHQNAVIVAAPGAGKTTRVPPTLIRAGLLLAPHPACVMLQPRRIAARAAAHRIASESKTQVGDEVGYQVRFERRLSSRTKIAVVTEGVLTRWMQDNPSLEGYGAVILDEFHERNLHTDLALALLREIQESVRPDLRIIVMSATLDAEKICSYLGDCPVFKSEGRQFPVQVGHRARSGIWSDTRSIDKDVHSALRELMSGTDDDGGHVLVFLPGVGEIRRCEESLRSWAATQGACVLPLHGSLQLEEQSRVLNPLAADSGLRRKIILATNIAETSLTIDGVSAVVDSGLVRVLRWDPKSGLERLDLARISMSSAVQRTGRAGRQSPGRALRLWTKIEESQLKAFEVPELFRTDLCSTCLTLADWGVTDLKAFRWFESPPADGIAAAQDLLKMLGALDAGGKITSLGRAMSSLPLHPRWAKVLIVAARQKDSSWLPIAAGEAAAASERTRLEDTARQLANLASRFSGDASLKVPDIRASEEILLMGFPDRVTRRRSVSSERGVMVGGRGVLLEDAALLGESNFFLSLDPEDTRIQGKLEARVRKAVPLRLETLERLFPEAFSERKETTWDEHRGLYATTVTTCFWDLPISDPVPVTVSAEESAGLLLDDISRDPLNFLSTDEKAKRWLSRWALLEKNNPGLIEGVSYGPEELASLIREFGDGKKSMSELRSIDWVVALESRLSFAQKKVFDREVPDALEVPSGSRIRLSFDAQGGGATLSVRLQEIFGWLETPRLAGGIVPVTLELLGPNFRPVQITNDLMSFWKRGYPEVRKELRARYPKHSWPEDPFSAKAEAKGRHRPR